MNSNTALKEDGYFSSLIPPQILSLLCYWIVWSREKVRTTASSLLSPMACIFAGRRQKKDFRLRRGTLGLEGLSIDQNLRRLLRLHRLKIGLCYVHLIRIVSPISDASTTSAGTKHQPKIRKRTNKKKKKAFLFFLATPHDISQHNKLTRYLVYFLLIA